MLETQAGTPHKREGPMTMLTIPAGATGLTNEWLTEALRSTDSIGPSTSVTAFSTEIIGAGAGFIGQLARVTLEYDRDDAKAPKALIAKYPTLDPAGREIGNMFRFYEREARFYGEIAGEVELRTPKPYFNGMDVEKGEYILLLEDLHPGRCGDQLESCAHAEVRMAVEEVAKFHATWWESRRLDEIDWMPRINDPVNLSAEAQYQQSWEPFLARWGDRLSPEMKAVGERFAPRVGAVLHKMADRPRTIVHGDFRLDNFFFECGEDTPFAVIDWQIANRGIGAFDIGYLFAGNLKTEMRRSHEQELLRLYHDTLVANGVKDYSFDDLYEDYRTSVMFSFVYNVIGSGNLDYANERGMQMWTAWLDRTTAAIADLDAGATLPG